ncbi:hypothetical protein CPB86DRAFT_801829 [Serendipita vermifera]|nr:hypothetical protein CPB86DRAFT_801829 [Serendipita vermifera]
MAGFSYEESEIGNFLARTSATLWATCPGIVTLGPELQDLLGIVSPIRRIQKLLNLEKVIFTDSIKGRARREFCVVTFRLGKTLPKIPPAVIPENVFDSLPWNPTTWRWSIESNWNQAKGGAVMYYQRSYDAAVKANRMTQSGLDQGIKALEQSLIANRLSILSICTSSEENISVSSIASALGLTVSGSPGGLPEGGLTHLQGANNILDPVKILLITSIVIIGLTVVMAACNVLLNWRKSRFSVH